MVNDGSARRKPGSVGPENPPVGSLPKVIGRLGERHGWWSAGFGGPVEPSVFHGSSTEQARHVDQRTSVRCPGGRRYLHVGCVHLSLIHISEPTRRTPISYAVFCLKKK